MKKSLVISFLLVCCFSFFNKNFAAPPVSVHVIHTKQLSIQKSFSFVEESMPQKAARSFTRDADTIIPSSISSHFAVAQFFIVLFTRPCAEPIISTAITERLRKDHLLHLFPSHYFW